MKQVYVYGAAALFIFIGALLLLVRAGGEGVGDPALLSYKTEYGLHGDVDEDRAVVETALERARLWDEGAMPAFLVAVSSSRDPGEPVRQTVTFGAPDKSTMFAVTLDARGVVVEEEGGEIDGITGTPLSVKDVRVSSFDAFKTGFERSEQALNRHRDNAFSDLVLLEDTRGVPVWTFVRAALDTEGVGLAHTVLIDARTGSVLEEKTNTVRAR